MSVSKNDELILSALISTQSIKQAAQKADVSEKTIFRRMKDPDFKKRYDDARHELFERSAANIQSYLDDAIKALGDIVNDPDASDQTRLNAAEAIIRNTLRLTERMDVLDRLDALERLLR